MGRATAKKLILFEKGVAAVKRYLPEASYYVCPLCQFGFYKSAIQFGHLTIEHVPPECVGGRGLLLTCYECNSLGGRTVDAELCKRQEQRRFRETVLGLDDGYKGRAKWSVGSETLNVEIYREGKFLTVAGLPKHNDPRVVQRMTENTLLSGRLTSRVRYNARWAAVSELRAAYLAAFALLGYRYALQPALRPVRRQISAPDLRTLEGWSLDVAPDIPVGRQIFEISEPFHCLAVQIDRVAVLLPIPGSSDDLYDRLPEFSGTGRRVTLSGSHLGWPQSMELTEDFRRRSRLPSLGMTSEEEPGGR